jgi:hypothetical protein
MAKGGGKKKKVGADVFSQATEYITQFSFPTTKKVLSKCGPRKRKRHRVVVPTWGALSRRPRPHPRASQETLTHRALATAPRVCTRVCHRNPLAPLTNPFRSNLVTLRTGCPRRGRRWGGGWGGREHGGAQCEDYHPGEGEEQGGGVPELHAARARTCPPLHRAPPCRRSHSKPESGGWGAHTCAFLELFPHSLRACLFD